MKHIRHRNTTKQEYTRAKEMIMIRDKIRITRDDQKGGTRYH